jgi:hypothetical protein
LLALAALLPTPTPRRAIMWTVLTIWLLLNTAFVVFLAIAARQKSIRGVN